MRQLCDTTEELLVEVFSVESMQRCYKQYNSRVWLAIRMSPACKDMNMELDGSTALEAITRQRLVKTQQTEET
jgi:hypothetical protein